MTGGQVKVTCHLAVSLFSDCYYNILHFNSSNNRFYLGHLSALLSHKRNYVPRGILFYIITIGINNSIFFRISP